MSDDKIRKKTTPHQIPQPPQISSVEEEKFMALMRQIGDTSLSNLSGEHITQVIEQRGKITEYVHEENMQDHEKFKISQRNALIQLGIIAIFSLTLIIIVAIVDKAYLPQALTLIVGFIGGFGIGKTFQNPPKKNE